MRKLLQTCLCAAMSLIAINAHSQNVLILTTGAVDTVADAENNYMPYVVNEYANPFVFADFNGPAPTNAPCANITQTHTDAVSGTTKAVTCNQTELANGTAMPADFFDAGYDLLVVASAYTTIDPADWAAIADAVETRKIRGVVLYIDSVNATNRNLIPNLLTASMGSTVGVGASFGAGNHYFPRNDNADVASYFAALPRMELNTGFSVYTGIPSELALYTGTSGASTAPSTSVPPGENTSAAAVFITHDASFQGEGACVFGIPDIGWGRSGTGLNIGKLGPAFLDVFNDPDGPCAEPLANPPVLKIEKTTSISTTSTPANNTAIPYTITVSNIGSSSLALNVGLTDAAPAGMTFGQWICTQTAPAAPADLCPTPLPTGHLDTIIASLPAGAILDFSVDATVTDNTQNLTNTATLALPVGATCENDLTPCASSVSLPSLGVEAKPVPSLSHLMTAMLALLLAGASASAWRKRA